MSLFKDIFRKYGIRVLDLGLGLSFIICVLKFRLFWCSNVLEDFIGFGILSRNWFLRE